MPNEVTHTIPGLTSIQLAILELMCSYKRPPSGAEIARQLGISATTVYSVLRSRRFQEAYQSIVLSVSSTALKTVVEKITEQAMAGKSSQQRMFLQMQGVIGNNDTAPEDPLPDNAKDLADRKAKLQQQLIDVLNKENKSEGKLITGVAFETEERKTHLFTDQNETKEINEENY